METLLRAALLAWLRDDPALTAALNAIEEESPVRASVPWLGIATSASADWSTKTCNGREVRLALELLTRGEDAASNGDLVAALEQRIRIFPRAHTGFDCVTVQFLRARAERRARHQRAILLEYRFRLLEPSPE